MMTPKQAGLLLGRLTTHVLDTASGVPASGMAVRLLNADTRAVLCEAVTNADGRITPALLEGDALSAGKYVLTFHVADYFRKRGITLPDPPFLDVVEIPFGLADPAAHYHVPLLVSPWSYSTYRGS
jgi:5-hydroxyisourate hydrolase